MPSHAHNPKLIESGPQNTLTFSILESIISIRIPVDNGMKLLEVHQGQLYSVQQNKIILDQGLIYS